MDSDGITRDSIARDIVESARRANVEIPKLKLLSGDLCKTLGGGRSLTGTTVICDLGSALLDGKIYWFISHLLAGTSLSSKKSLKKPVQRRVDHKPETPSRAPLKGLAKGLGEFFFVMNSAWLGDLNLAPKSHPADGRLDALQGKLGYRQSRHFLKLAKSGTHLPHPDIKYTKRATIDYAFPKPTPVYLDGTFVTKVKNLVVRIEPEAIEVII